MKKIGIIALALTVGATCAYAASIKVPWFVDNAAVGAGLPPTVGSGGNQTLTLVSLSNTTATVLECSIAYYSSLGTFVGPTQNGIDNTFIIEPNATVQFRPVASDLVDANTNPRGQESAAGDAVPNRPVGGKNGSITITYQGEPKDMAGMVQFFSSSPGADTAYSSAYSLIPLFGSV